MELASLGTGLCEGGVSLSGFRTVCGRSQIECVQDCELLVLA